MLGKKRLVTYAICHQIAGGQGSGKILIFIEYAIFNYHLYLYTRSPMHKFVHMWSPSAWPGIGANRIQGPSRIVPIRNIMAGQRGRARRVDCGGLAAGEKGLIRAGLSGIETARG